MNEKSSLIKEERYTISDEVRVVGQKMDDQEEVSSTEEDENEPIMPTEIDAQAALEQYDEQACSEDAVTETTVEDVSQETCQQQGDAEQATQQVEQTTEQTAPINAVEEMCEPALADAIKLLFDRSNYVTCFQFAKCMQDIMTYLQKNDQVDGATQWYNSFKQSMEKIQAMVPEIEFLFSNAEQETFTESYGKMFGAELEHLQPLNTFIVTYGHEAHKEQYLELIQKLRGDVVSADDVANLQQMLKSISEETYEQIRWNTANEQQLLQQCFERTVDIYMNVLDVLDLMIMAVKQSEVHREIWVPMLDAVCYMAMEKIESYHLQQIDVENMLLDGKYMMSIGTVPQQQVPHLEKFAVYQQMQRGFINRTTGQVIREAKVITVY